MFFFYTKMNQASNSYLPSANCVSVCLSHCSPVYAAVCPTVWLKKLNSEAYQKLSERADKVQSTLCVSSKSLIMMLLLWLLLLCCCCGWWSSLEDLSWRWPPMTNLLAWTPHADCPSLSVCLACFIIWLNKTQPAKMAKAMNSFGFLRYPLPPRPLPLCLAYWVPAKMYLTCLMDFWGPGTQCAETEP